MGMLDSLKTLIFGPKIERTTEYKITIPLTEENKNFLDQVLRYKLGRMTGLSQQALKKIRELEEKQMKTVKVNVAEEMEKLVKQRALDIINYGAVLQVVTDSKEVKVVSFNHSYLGIYHSFRRYKGLVYILFYTKENDKKHYILLGGKPRLEDLLTDPDTLDKQIKKLGIISIRFMDDGRYVPREIVKY